MFYLYLALFIFFILLLKLIIIDKVRIKWKTFFSKGFKAKRGNFGLYSYTGNQGKGKTLSLVEYIFDNRCNSIFFLNIKDIKCLEYLKDCDFRSVDSIEDTNQATKNFEVDSLNSESITFIDSPPFDLSLKESTENLQVSFSEQPKNEVSSTNEFVGQLANAGDYTSTTERSLGTSLGAEKLTGMPHNNKGVGLPTIQNDVDYSKIDLDKLFIDKEYKIKNKGLGIYYDGISGLIEVKHKLDSGYYDSIIKDKQIVFVFDELFTEFTRYDKLSLEVQDFLCQLRKRKIIFLTTAQVWSELPLYLRRLCRYQINCDIINLPTYSILIKEFRDAENMKWDNDLQEHVAPTLETSITKCRKIVSDSYNTLERINNDETRRNEKKNSIL